MNSPQTPTALDRSITLREALAVYLNRVSILKKGYGQERYRIDQTSRSMLGSLIVKDITSVNIASYRDLRLSETNPRTLKKLTTSTVRLELSLLSNFFEIGRIEWGICDENPVSKVRKTKPPPGRDRRLTPREDRLILRYAHSHANLELYSIIVIALESAMRQGEILSMTWEHVNDPRLKTRASLLRLKPLIVGLTADRLGDWQQLLHIAQSDEQKFLSKFTSHDHRRCSRGRHQTH